MQVDVTRVFVLAAVIVTSRAQLTDIAGSTSVSVSPTDATCGRTSADSYCQVDVAADAGCVVHTCRTVCEGQGEQPTYTDLLRGVSGFNHDDSVTNTTKDFGDGDVTVAVFNKMTRMAYLRRSINMTSPNEFTLTFRIRPDDMAGESSVVDFHGAHYGHRVFNVRLDSDLRLTIVSDLVNVTRETWKIPRHAWTHVAVQFHRNGVKVFLNGSDESPAATVLQLNDAADMSHLNLKVGQTFAGDITETHLVEDVSCTKRTRTDSPPDDAFFCRGKMDGWYSQPPSGYTQCADGRQVTVRYCQSEWHGVYGGHYFTVQCMFCSSSCTCESKCTVDDVKAQDHKERCDALGFVCRDGERKEHPKYCDVYYFCVRGKYIRKKCIYPDRWSVEHGQCERFHFVSCGKRIPKNHPCDRENTAGRLYGPADCIIDKHPANCTGREDGLYYKKGYDGCSVYGCLNETLATLKGNNLLMFADSLYRSTYGVCTTGGINPTTGVCDSQGTCPQDTTGYLADSPYFWCTEGETSQYRYDCHKYWRCRSKLWTVQTCPGHLLWSVDKKQCVSDATQCGNRWVPETDDLKVRQFLGQLADIRLYDKVLSASELTEIYSPVCVKWGRDAHPVDYVVDSDVSTFWLSRPHLDSVDLLLDLRQTYKLEEVSMTFFGPVPLVVSIFRKVTADDSWQLWRVFRDDCSDDEQCTQLGAMKLDGDRLLFNLLDAGLGPLQRRATSLRVRLSGHRQDGAALLRNISYFGLYSVTVSRRPSSRCGVYSYVVYESSRTCLPCHCDVRGVRDGNIECNEVGGQCTCKRYVTGRRCDRCLSGNDNIQQSDPGGCSDIQPATTAAVDQLNKSSPAAEGSSTAWLLYTIPVVVVIGIIATIVVICVRRRRQQRDPGTATEDPTYEQPLPGVVPDASSDYTLMTRPVSDKVQRGNSQDIS